MRLTLPKEGLTCFVFDGTWGSLLVFKVLNLFACTVSLVPLLV